MIGVAGSLRDDVPEPRARETGGTLRLTGFSREPRGTLVSDLPPVGVPTRDPATTGTKALGTRRVIDVITAKGA